MGIFDFFKKKSTSDSRAVDTQVDNTPPDNQQVAAQSPVGMDEDFVDKLISFFESQPEVSNAYFGMLQHSDTNTSHLFLAVDHNGDENYMMQQTWNIKTQCQPLIELHYTSIHTDSNLFEAVKESNFAFYEKGAADALQLLLVKHIFDPGKYREQLMNAIRNGNVLSLFLDFNPSGNSINFQTFKRPSGEFIPIFSSMEMIAKSGMKEVPQNLTIMMFDYGKLDEMINFHEKGALFVLNPGTAFEFEFFA